MKVKATIKKPQIKNIGLFVCLVYILLRPLLNTYVTENIKYIFILVMVYYAIKGITNKKIWKEIGYGEIILCLFFVLYVLISSIIAGGGELIVYTIERYVFYMIPLFVIPVVEHRINWDNLLTFLSWYGLIDSIISITEFFIHRQLIPLEGITHSVVQQFGDDSIRTFGLNGNYFLLAEILCLCAFATLYLSYRYKRKSEIIKLIVIGVGVFSTGSRGYYVSFIVGLFIFYILSKMNERKPREYIVKIGCFILLFATLLCVIFMTNISTGNIMIDTFLSRARSIFDFSENYANVTRLQIWINSINKWKQHPILGNGASITDTRYSKFEGVTESGLLKRLVELGIIGTLLQYSTMIIPLIKGYRLFKITHSSDNLIYIFFFSLIVALATEDMVLQRYGEIEFSIVIWSALAFVCTYKRRKLSRIDG